VCMCVCVCEREGIEGDEPHGALGHALTLLDREEPRLCVCVYLCVGVLNRERESVCEREVLKVMSSMVHSGTRSPFSIERSPSCVCV
jgi:hypothetical protein